MASSGAGFKNVRTSSLHADPLMEAAMLLGLEIEDEPDPEDIFDEEPVPLDVFITDRMYLRSPPLSDVQKNFVEAGTTFYRPSTHIKLNHYIDSYVTELVAQWGKGGGKDHCCRAIAARAVYMILCLKDPHAYYNMAPDSSIDIINVAYNSAQANNVYFTPFRRLIGASPWFRDRFDDKQGFIAFDKNVQAISGHSDQEGLEGYNPIVTILDEIAAFKTAYELRNRRALRAASHSAEGIYDSMTSSVQSRFPGLGKVIMLSYPRYRGDFIQQKYKEGEHDPAVYVSFATTWEANPTKNKEDFASEYRRNPEQARAKYECDPPRAIDTYFKRPHKIDLAFDVDLFEADSEILEDGTPKEKFDYDRHLLTEDGKLLPSTLAPDRIPRAIHVDAAISNDRAGFAMSHVSGWIHRVIDKQVHKFPVVKTDLMCYWTPKPNDEVNLSEIRELITELKNHGYNIQLVTYDGYQSADSIQILNSYGIEAKTRSVDRDTSAYDTLKDLIYDERLDTYYCWLVVDELKSLTTIQGGQKVDHPDHGSKDVSDALAGSVQGAIEVIADYQVQSRARPRSFKVG